MADIIEIAESLPIPLKTKLLEITDKIPPERAGIWILFVTLGIDSQAVYLNGGDDSEISLSGIGCSDLKALEINGLLVIVDYSNDGSPHFYVTKEAYAAAKYYQLNKSQKRLKKAWCYFIQIPTKAWGAFFLGLISIVIVDFLKGLLLGH